MAATKDATADGDAGIVMRTLIRGTLPLHTLKPFVYLVKSLCPETGQLSEFREYDRIYNPSPEVRSGKNSIRLRTRFPGRNPTPSTLQFLGPPERRVPAPCERRPITNVVVGPDIETFLEYIGCTFSYEYVRKGVRHRTRGGLTIDVFLVERLTKRGDYSASEFLTPGDQLCVVEVWVDDATSPDPLLTFMQHLMPYVTLPAPTGRRR